MFRSQRGKPGSSDFLSADSDPEEQEVGSATKTKSSPKSKATELPKPIATRTSPRKCVSSASGTSPQPANSDPGRDQGQRNRQSTLVPLQGQLGLGTRTGARGPMEASCSNATPKIASKRPCTSQQALEPSLSETEAKHGKRLRETVSNEAVGSANSVVSLGVGLGSASATKSKSQAAGVDIGEGQQLGLWEKPNEHLLVFTSRTVPQSAALTKSGKSVPVVGFDLDDTLVCSKSKPPGTHGRSKYPEENDWRIFYEVETREKLATLAKEGYLLAIISNQRGVTKGHVTEPSLRRKVEGVIAALSEGSSLAPLPMFGLFAINGGIYRKPCTGMWEHVEHILASNYKVTVDRSKSIYVGDAAGRPEGWMPGRKKDFANSDRLLAINLDLKFFTPEEFFLGKTPSPFSMPDFDPRKVDDQMPLIEPSSATLTRADSKPEMIMMVGYPASGKSHFVRQHLVPKGYVHINQDTLKTADKCARVCDESLQKGLSVAIDNTNMDLASRRRFLDIALKHKVPVRCFLMKITLDHAMHNELYRQIFEPEHSKINDMIFYSFRKKYVEPTLSEGFESIARVNLIPSFESGSVASASSGSSSAFVGQAQARSPEEIAARKRFLYHRFQDEA